MERYRKSLTFVIALILCLPFVAFAKTTYIKDLRVTQHQNKWRLVFDASAPIHFRKIQLKEPPRIVFDIQDAYINSELLNPKNPRLQKLLRSSPVKKIRTSATPENALRLVLDLRKSAAANVFTLNPSHNKPYRLVLDISKLLKLNSGLAKRHPRLVAGSKIKKKNASPILSVFKKTNKPPRNVIIVIDPGHGGKDPGATGPRGTHEKNVVLKISRRLQRIINQQPGFKAVLTRKGDYYISLRRRLALARKYHADMFVAIHADAYRNRQAHGASVYALSRRGATGEAARWLAKRENASELMGGVDLSDKGNLLKSVLINLSQTATIRASLLMGKDLIRSLDRIASLHHRKVEQAAFVVLKSPDIPSLLVETGFLSNPYEERRLRTPQYRERLAQALMQGIRQYYKHRPPRGTWLAYWRDHPKLANSMS